MDQYSVVRSCVLGAILNRNFPGEDDARKGLSLRRIRGTISLGSGPHRTKNAAALRSTESRETNTTPEQAGSLSSASFDKMTRTYYCHWGSWTDGHGQGASPSASLIIFATAGFSRKLAPVVLYRRVRFFLFLDMVLACSCFLRSWLRWPRIDCHLIRPSFRPDREIDRQVWVHISFP